ncbi:MAG: ABC transporter ATP-binding protein [Bacilli bacterium]|nr:ABC transporter ATP-binding protein [Bacilli bacterium]
MKKTITNLRKTKYFFDNCWKDIILIFMMGVVINILINVIPSVNGNLINKILSSSFKVTLIIALVGGFLQILNTVLNLKSSKMFLNLKKNVTLNIKHKVLKKILNLNMSYFDKNTKGALLGKLNKDSKNIVSFLNNTKDSLLAAISNIITLVYILYLNYIIGIYYIIANTIIVFIRYHFIKKSNVYLTKNIEIKDQNAAFMGEIIRGAKDVKVLKLKSNFENKNVNNFTEEETYEFKSNYYLEVGDKICHFLESVFYGLMIIISIFLIKAGLMEKSKFIIIFMYKSTVFNFSNKLSSLIKYLSYFNISCDRIFSILETNSEEFGVKSLNNYKGNIEFKNISFGYNDEILLKDISFKIKPNTFNIITGPNGTGKTTIFNLITKMYTPNKGKILLDNIDINTLSEESIRTNISLVTQQPYVFNMSIKENLSIINEDFEKIKKVCELVGLKEKIESLEDGYDTIVGTDGRLLSGGEKQRLAIARVLLSDTKVILFDEITNNIDQYNKQIIIDLINTLKKDYTIIMITHDMDLTKNADHIYTIANHKIKEV